MPEPTDDVSRRLLVGALAGLLAALAALAAAELASAFVRPEASPVVAVGDAVVDATPTWLREWAITQFGTNDKHVLVGSIFVVLVLLSLVTGALAVRRRAVGLAGVAVLGLVGAAAAATRPDAEPLDPYPSLVGAVIGAMALIVLLRPIAAGSSVAPDDQRRQLLVTALWVSAAAVAAGTFGRLANSRRGDVAAARAAVELPAPSSPATPLPPGTELKIKDLSTFTTPNKDFYRIDTALIVPQIDPDGWSLKVHGMVDREVELDFAAAAPPADGRAGRHADLRLERGRRQPRGQRPVARGAAGRPARGGRRRPAGRHDPEPVPGRDDHRHPHRCRHGRPRRFARRRHER